MTTNFPTGLDSFVNPNAGAGNTLASVPHDAQHANANDAIAALEAKVGVDGSAVVTSLDYRVAALETGGGSPSFATVEKNLGSAPKMAGRFTITGLSGLTIGKPVIISQAVAPYTGKGTRADEAEMDGIVAKASVTAVDTITAYWNSATRVKGNIKFNYLIGA